MKQFGYVLTAAVAMLMVAGQQQAQAQDPREILDNCSEELREIVRRCVTRNADTTKETVRKVKALLEQGNRERARAVAARGKRQLAADTDQCVEKIHMLCRRCVNALLDANAPRAARHFREACENAVEKVRQSERRGCHAIEEALEG